MKFPQRSKSPVCLFPEEDECIKIVCPLNMKCENGEEGADCKCPKPFVLINPKECVEGMFQKKILLELRDT